MSDQVIVRLIEKGLTITTAESCTGGLLAGRIVDTPGSSAVFPESFVTYSNEAKTARRGVSPATLATRGAVSAECAVQMAEGARARANTDFALATTGIAGPEGGSDEKPVGLVYIALAGKDGTVVREYHFSGDRDSVRSQTVDAALDILNEEIDRVSGRDAVSQIPESYQQAIGMRPARQKMAGWLKVLIGLILVTAAAILIYSLTILAHKSLDIIKNGENQELEEYLKPYLDGGKDQDKKKENDAPADQGIDSIEAYIQDDLGYEIKEESFSEQENEDKYRIALHVDYPVLSGLKQHGDEINQTIRDFAMQTEKAIYENPDPDGRQKILELDQVYVIDEVEYKVTYATDDFISIVFNDASVFGEASDQKVQVRTLNMDLRSGEIYQLQDVFDLENDDFLKAWEKSLKEEAGTVLGDKLPDLNAETDREILSGQDKDYPNAFFVDKAGGEIGLSLCKDEKEVGWVTAPFVRDELIRYKTGSDFWKQVTWK